MSFTSAVYGTAALLVLALAACGGGDPEPQHTECADQQALAPELAARPQAPCREHSL